MDPGVRRPPLIFNVDCLCLLLTSRFKQSVLTAGGVLGAARKKRGGIHYTVERFVIVGLRSECFPK